jgi:4-hydroxy-2-oxoheptanedioate aldolase
MNLPANAFLAALRAGRPQIGVWLTLASPYAAEVVAGAGFDWALVDMEHAPADIMPVMGQLQVLASHGTPGLVRPVWNDAVQVKRLLDIGAQGLLFPMVQTADEAARAVAACRYPPRGIRGVSSSSRANGFGRVEDYFDRVEDETAILLQIESRAAMAAAVQIGTTDGVDGVLFGPSDIAADMGLLGQPMHPAVWEAILPTARRLIDAGVPVGTLVTDLAFARNLMAQGFTFIACAVDTVILSRGADAVVAAMKG